MNQELQHYLRAYTNFQQDDWAQWLSLAQLNYNRTAHSTLGISPSKALMGFRPSLGNEVWEKCSEGAALNAEQRAEEIREQRELLRDTLAKAKDAMAKQYNKHHKLKTFRLGDEVYLRAKNIKTIHPNVKLDHRQLGPFRIIGIVGTQAYKLELPEQYRRIHPVFHVSLLEPCYMQEGESRRPPPIPVEDGGEEYKVEKILKHRKDRKRMHYLTKWVGYPNEENTWEPKDHVEDTEAFEIYHRDKEIWECRHRRQAEENYSTGKCQDLLLPTGEENRH